MLKYLLFIFIILFSACTWNIIQTSTHGSASDVVDSDPQTEADVSPTITAPLPLGAP